MYHPRRIELDPPRRVMIIGSPGSEKTSLGEAIAKRLSLPLIDLQQEYWKPGWKQPDPRAWREHVADLAAREEWIIVGTFPSTMDLRAQRSDWIVWLDMPMIGCFSRKVRQLFGRAGSPVPEGLVGGPLPARLKARLLRFTWSFPALISPRIADLISRERRNRSIFILRSKREREEFLARVPTLGDLGRDVAGGQPEG